MKNELTEIIEAIKSRILLEQEAGMTEFVLAAPREAVVRQAKATDDKTAGLEALRREVLKCERCDLAKTRTNVVFGAGSAQAKLVFVGEAPGGDEDLQGLPFVGRAGQLLTKIIEAMGMKRSDVYIANILKCRPPNNRAPLPAEILACEENVRRQIEIIKPAVIVTLGKFASQTLLKTERPISALRGKFQEYSGIKVMPTFHPAYLLRNPGDKKLVWDDMKKVMSQL